MPVPKHGEDEQQKSNQQQPGSFRGIDRVPMVFVVRVVVALSMNHDCIVRRAEPGAQWCYTTRRQSFIVSR